MLGASPLESQVVLGADAGKHCQLFAAQTRRAALSAGYQPDIFGMDLVPPRTQEITQRVGFRRHRPSVFRASATHSHLTNSGTMPPPACTAPVVQQM